MATNNGLAEKLLLKPEEVQKVLGLGRTRVYALIASGDLPCVRIGGSVRVPTEGLRTWIEEHQVKKG
jgi:excisionase family DNA binding protein